MRWDMFTHETNAWIREALDKMLYIILENHNEAKKNKIISFF
jgi:hypothetical protein